jgi:hypothetical protein
VLLGKSWPWRLFAGGELGSPPYEWPWRFYTGRRGLKARLTSVAPASFAGGGLGSSPYENRSAQNEYPGDRALPVMRSRRQHLKNRSLIAYRAEGWGCFQLPCCGAVAFWCSRSLDDDIRGVVVAVVAAACVVLLFLAAGKVSHLVRRSTGYDACVEYVTRSCPIALW